MESYGSLGRCDCEITLIVLFGRVFLEEQESIFRVVAKVGNGEGITGHARHQRIGIVRDDLDVIAVAVAPFDIDTAGVVLRPDGQAQYRAARRIADGVIHVAFHSGDHKGGLQRLGIGRRGLSHDLISAGRQVREYDRMIFLFGFAQGAGLRRLTGGGYFVRNFDVRKTQIIGKIFQVDGDTAGAGSQGVGGAGFRQQVAFKIKGLGGHDGIFLLLGYVLGPNQGAEGHHAGKQQHSNGAKYRKASLFTLFQSLLPLPQSTWTASTRIRIASTSPE